MAITNKKDKYYNQGVAFYQDQKAGALNTSNTLYDGQVKSTNEGYDTQVFEQGRAYEDQFRENAVQKEINKRQIAESMANLGVRDSGLNRTQQTAAELSHANNNANIQRQRQADIDNLEFSRRQALDTIEQNRIADNAKIEQDYDNLALQYGENLRAQDEAEAEAKKTEAKNLVLEYLAIGATPPENTIKTSGMTDSEIKAYQKYYNKALRQKATKNANSSSNESKYKVRTAGGSGLDDQGNEVYYFYDENGTKKTYPKGTNPYNGKPITGGYTANELKEFGVWNGYQPKGVKYNGENYGKVEQYIVQDENGKPITCKILHQGHEKTVWKTKDGQLWVWDDNVGNYVRAWDEGNGEIEFEE